MPLDGKTPSSSQQPLLSNIRKALEDGGLTELSMLESPSSSKYSSWVIVFHQGYLVVRFWPNHKYCACDLQLWNQIDKEERVVAGLVAAVGGKFLEQSTSSYQITTGGMFGLDDSLDSDAIRRTATTDKHQEPQQGEQDDNALRTDDVATTMTLPRDKFDAVIQEAASFLTSESNPLLVVVCSDDDSSACTSLEALSSNTLASNDSVVPVWGCSSLLFDITSSAGEHQLAQPDDLNNAMLDCEHQIRNSLYNTVRETKDRRIDGIVIDSDVPREMGQIVHKVFNSTLVRYDLLSDHFIIVMPTSKDNSGNASWRNEFMERFRTEIVRFNPLFHSLLVVDSAEHNIALRLLSAGDKDYYARLIECLARILEKTGLSFDIENSIVGALGHIPDYGPEIISSKEDYNLESSRMQYLSQTPLGYQFIVQFEVQPTREPGVGDAVMIKRGNSIETWWSPGVVFQRKEDGMYVVDTKLGKRLTVDRAEMRMVDEYSNVEPLEFGELVVQKDGGDEAIIVFAYTDGQYRVQDFVDGDLSIVEREELIRLAEKQIDPQLPTLSSFQLKNVLVDVIRLLEPNTRPEENKVHIQMIDVGDGCVLTAFFKGGGIVASWDGRVHVDVNVFLENAAMRKHRKEFETIFLDQIPDLKVVQQNNQPRGYGRVVNFPEEIWSNWWFGRNLKHS